MAPECHAQIITDIAQAEKGLTMGRTFAKPMILRATLLSALIVIAGGAALAEAPRASADGLKAPFLNVIPRTAEELSLIHI